MATKFTLQVGSMQKKYSLPTFLLKPNIINSPSYKRRARNITDPSITKSWTPHVQAHSPKPMYQKNVAVIHLKALGGLNYATKLANLGRPI